MVRAGHVRPRPDVAGWAQPPPAEVPLGVWGKSCDPVMVAAAGCVGETVGRETVG